MNSKTAKAIRELRYHLGLTQEQFAVKVGTTSRTINRWENGKANPSPMAERLLELLMSQDKTHSQR